MDSHLKIAIVSAIFCAFSRWQIKAANNGTPDFVTNFWCCIFVATLFLAAAYGSYWALH